MPVHRFPALSPALLLSLLLAGLPAAPARAQAPAEPYQVALWADVVFGADGRAGKVEFVDAGQWPPAFLRHVEEKVAAHAVPARGGEFRSGVLAVVEIRPGASGSSASVLQVSDMPRPTKGDQGNPLRLRLKGEWSGSFEVRCRVGANGRCAKPEMASEDNVPAEMQRMIKSIAAGWRFQPQTQDGVPVEGEYRTRVEVEADTSAPPRTFDKRI